MGRIPAAVRRALACAAVLSGLALALVALVAPLPAAAADSGLIFAGVRDGAWGLWHRDPAGTMTQLQDGEVRGPVARAGWLAYADPAGSILIAPTDGSAAPRPVADLPTPCGQPSLSPDGTALVVACFRFANRQDDGALFRVDLPGLAVTPLYDGPGLQKSPAFSPDGQQVAFVSGFRLSAERVIEHVWVIDAAGGAARPLADRGDVNIDVDWLDADTLVFASDRGGDGTRLWRIGTDGTAAAPLTAGPADMETSVAPDGTLAFVGLAGDAFRLLTQPAGDPAARQIAVVTDEDGFTAAHDPYWTQEY